MDHTKNLIAYLKITRENLRTLHRHLQGGSWQSDHELLEEYYKKIDEIEDSIIESFLSLEIPDISIAEASEIFKLDDIRAYLDLEAFARVRRYFERLIIYINLVKENCDLPAHMISKFEEYEYYLFLESNYKLKQRLNRSDLGYLFKDD